MSIQHVNDDDESVSEQHTDKQVAKFPFPLYTYLLLACIAAVYLVQLFTTQDPEFIAMDRFAAYFAGFDKQAFLNQHQYWRILTGATVHSGVLHVLMNSYALYSFGRLIELLSNRAHLAIVFILSALGGGVLSLVFNPEVTSVGASGGIVGLLSYLAVYAFRRRQFIAAEFRRSLLINIGFILVFGLVLFNTIDNFGHVGGLIVGAIYAFIQIPGDEYVDPRSAGTFVKFLGVASIVIYILTSLFTIWLLINAG
ncbi:MAG TPA: rhomboid family intramembrane serine protease [Pyrinomonadaceae bacterium]|nr:rhomboid family intramembrane serine protease [Pyrinomonadaceae bacterium]